MIKLDEPIVRKILGTTNVKKVISDHKCARLYYKDTGKVEDAVLILTPMLAEDGEFLKNLLWAQKMGGHEVKATEHKVGRNYAYTYEEIKS